MICSCTTQTACEQFYHKSVDALWLHEVSKQRKETKPDKQEDLEGERWEGAELLLKNTLRREKVSSRVICLIDSDSDIIKHIKPQIIFGKGLYQVSWSHLWL